MTHTQIKAQLCYIYLKCIQTLSLAISNSLLYMFPDIFDFLNGVHVYIVSTFELVTFVQIPSLDLSHSTFLCVLNYVALLKHVFNLTLHYSTTAFSSY